LPELTAGVQVGEHQLHSGYAELGVNVHRDTTAVVDNGDGATLVNLNNNLGAIACQVLVDGVIKHLKNAVVQAAFIRIAYVHARALTDGLQTLQLVDLRRAVLLLCPGGDYRLGVLWGRGVICHTAAIIRAYTRARQYLYMS